MPFPIVISSYLLFISNDNVLITFLFCNPRFSFITSLTLFILFWCAIIIDKFNPLIFIYVPYTSKDNFWILNVLSILPFPDEVIIFLNIL